MDTAPYQVRMAIILLPPRSPLEQPYSGHAVSGAACGGQRAPCGWTAQLHCHPHQTTTPRIEQGHPAGYIC